METNKKRNLRNILAIFLCIAIVALLFNVMSDYSSYKSKKLSNTIYYFRIQKENFLALNYRRPCNFDELLSYIEEDDQGIVDSLKLNIERYSLRLFIDSADSKFRIISLGLNKKKDNKYIWVDSLKIIDYLFTSKDIVFYEETNSDSICSRPKFHTLLICNNKIVTNDNVVHKFSNEINRLLKDNLMVNEFDSIDFATTKNYLLNCKRVNEMLECKLICPQADDYTKVKIFEDSISFNFKSIMIDNNLNEVYIPFVLRNYYKQGRLVIPASFEAFKF
jgi:hypothetical protein